MATFNTEFFHEVLPNQLDIFNLPGTQTAVERLYERASYFAQSKLVSLIGPIYHDLFAVDRFLLNQVGVAIKFYRSKPEFCLITNELTPDYDIIIEEMFLRIHKVHVNPAVIMGHNQMLSRTNAKYPFTRTDIKMLTIGAGQWTNDCGMQLSRDDIARGFALYAFNLEPNFPQGGYLTLLKQAICRLDVKFDSSLSEPINCMIYAEFPGYFEVNQSRDIII
ncbi:hypothetical protein KUTeg_001293 [Tegillarca granosa]|uniref:Uncharacterized protein n=1 Tax=Tegillarca granosa TaxID=220873 RepID=A0ABQ9FV89_TEGGR|nr:hypothetical protein KUTeg_001293 [Tegillarca granosa]